MYVLARDSGGAGEKSNRVVDCTGVDEGVDWLSVDGTALLELPCRVSGSWSDVGPEPHGVAARSSLAIAALLVAEGDSSVTISAPLLLTARSATAALVGRSVDVTEGDWVVAGFASASSTSSRASAVPSSAQLSL